jgi:DNA ligase 1
MSAIFKPMLAAEADLSKLQFPLLASPKLDGIRAVVRGGVVYSRSNKPIPNKFVQERFCALEGFDGELIVGHSNAHDVYRQTTSHVMSHDKTGFDVAFHAFDFILCDGGYDQRSLALNEAWEKHYLKTPVYQHEQLPCGNLDALLEYEKMCLDRGYEGLILRKPDGQYKMGRSTVREGLLLKMKRFVDAEAVVIGFEERMHNGNEATVSELGRTKRSSHKANKSGRGDLGALVCRTADGIEFNIGTGLCDAERERIWANRDQYLGQLAKFKYFPVGVKEAPRHPVFLGWRDRRDM